MFPSFSAIVSLRTLKLLKIELEFKKKYLMKALVYRHVAVWIIFQWKLLKNTFLLSIEESYP